MKNKAWRMMSIISLLVVVGCSSSDEIVYRHLARVENVNIRLLDDENSLEIEVSGHHRNGCQYLDGYDVSIDADTITVQVWEWRPESDGSICVMITKPFNTTITVDVSELSSREYNVDVNGVSTFFAINRSLPASVESVNARVLDNALELEVTGELRDGCHSLNGYDVVVENASQDLSGDTSEMGSIHISLWERNNIDPTLITACTLAPVPFTTIITVDTSELTPGQYDVVVGDIDSASTTITLLNN